MNIDIADTMVRTAMDSMRNAYVLYDGIVAGACALAADGTLYSGCTIDHPIPEYSLSAEIVAMARAISDGKREFDAIAIVADIEGLYSPNEETFLFLQQFEIGEIILADLEGNVKYLQFDEIVPYKKRARN